MISTIKSQTNHKKTKIHISLSQHLVYIHVHISFISFDETKLLIKKKIMVGIG
jgi:hypothetical protein